MDRVASWDGQHRDEPSIKEVDVSRRSKTKNMTLKKKWNMCNLHFQIFTQR